MRDFRDAKSMAHDLRGALAAKNYKITLGESLEIIARLFGAADWNTLAARIKTAGGMPASVEPRPRGQGIRFSDATEAALHLALRAAEERFHSESTLEHLLFALTDTPDAAALIASRGIDAATIRALVADSAELRKMGDPSNSSIDTVPSSAFQRVVRRAIQNANAANESEISPAYLLVAIASEQDGTAVRILREHGFDPGGG